ncbi:MAG: UDP-glucose 4-epimerase GalE [Beijerinckiaceae bacterium]
MTVLVTGGAGYIGSHMVLELLDRGEKVIVLDNLSTGFDWAVPQGVQLYVGETGNLALTSSVIRAHGVTSVIHFAASIVVPDSVSDPLSYYLNNTVNSRALIEAAVKGGVRNFIFSSTAAVYGTPDRSPIAETDRMNPESPYGMSKLMTEAMLRHASEAHGLKHVILRYFNVAGADPRGRSGQSSERATHLIKIAAEVATGKRAGMSIFGRDYATPDGTCIRDYIHVSDLARAHSAALDHLRGGGENGTFNCGYGRGFSVIDVIDMVKKVSGKDFPVAMAERRAGDPASLVADNARIRGTLGWKPTLDDLPTIVSHALAWEEKLKGKNR